MSAAPRLLHDAPTDPLTLALAPLADAVAARVEPRPAPAPWVDEGELARVARRYFVDCAYEHDGRLRQALRAAWVAGFRAGAAALREAD